MSNTSPESRHALIDRLGPRALDKYTYGRALIDEGARVLIKTAAQSHSHEVKTLALEIAPFLQAIRQNTYSCVMTFGPSFTEAQTDLSVIDGDIETVALTTSDRRCDMSVVATQHFFLCRPSIALDYSFLRTNEKYQAFYVAYAGLRAQNLPTHQEFNYSYLEYGSARDEEPQKTQLYVPHTSLGKLYAESHPRRSPAEIASILEPLVYALDLQNNKNLLSSIADTTALEEMFSYTQDDWLRVVGDKVGQYKLNELQWEEIRSDLGYWWFKHRILAMEQLNLEEAYIQRRNQNNGPVNQQLMASDVLDYAIQKYYTNPPSTISMSA